MIRKQPISSFNCIKIILWFHDKEDDRLFYFLKAEDSVFFFTLPMFSTEQIVHEHLLCSKCFIYNTIFQILPKFFGIDSTFVLLILIVQMRYKEEGL